MSSEGRASRWPLKKRVVERASKEEEWERPGVVGEGLRLE